MTKDNPVLHLMVNNTCTNDCPLCCNKQYNVDDIPVVTVEELRNTDTICFTGGQPLLNICSFSRLCDCIERCYPNIKNAYVYMNGAELFSVYNTIVSNKKMLFENFPCNTHVSYGLTMSPKCEKDWSVIQRFEPYMMNWKSNRIYCFSEADMEMAIAIFPQGSVEIVMREWQQHFVPAPNTIFRRLPVWIS